MPKLVSHHVLPNNLKLIGWQGKNYIPISNLIERKCVKSWESLLKADKVWESMLNVEKVCYKLRKYAKVC